jgi:hypothetical protein
MEIFPPENIPDAVPAVPARHQHGTRAARSNGLAFLVQIVTKL